MNRNYLIPANTKKSLLIVGWFTKLDLWIFSIGVGWSFLMLLIIKNMNLAILILVLLPGLIATFLVLPVPHYHNVLQLLTNIFNFYTNRRQYYWKGWSIHEGINSNNK